MSRALKSAGNEIEMLEMPGVTHGFLSYGKALSEVEAAITRSAKFIQHQLPVRKFDPKRDLKAQPRTEL
jgi:acetyl esterase/lipase